MSPRRNRFLYDKEERRDDREEISRSRRKRDSAALQVVGEELAALPPAKLALLPLPSDLRTALEDCRRLPGREAKRRQMQYVGRLMREAQEEGSLQPVLEALAGLE